MGKAKVTCLRSRRDLNWLEKLRWCAVVDRVFGPKHGGTGKWYKEVCVSVEKYVVNHEVTLKREKLIVVFYDGEIQEYRMSFLNNRGCRDREPRNDRTFRLTGA